jgi:Mn-dependent DtxR family transcriptional regulator
LTDRHVDVLEHVIANPGATAKTTARALDLVRKTVQTRLRDLERDGLIEGELSGGGELAYEATDEGRAQAAGDVDRVDRETVAG